MKSLMFGFLVALLVAVIFCGFAGQPLYWMWRNEPDKTFQVLAGMFALIWWFAMAGRMIWSAFAFDDAIDWLLLKFRRRPAFDVAGAVARDSEIHQAALRSLQEQRREQSGNGSAVSTEGGVQ